MPDLEHTANCESSLTEPSDVSFSAKDAEKAMPPKGPNRNQSTFSSSGRKISEWEALQIAEAGDLQTINGVIDAVEEDLQQLNIKSTWLKPLLKFSDPRHFTWLLVGKQIEIGVVNCD
jgi:hypothetical protein